MGPDGQLHQRAWYRNATFQVLIAAALGLVLAVLIPVGDEITRSGAKARAVGVITATRGHTHEHITVAWTDQAGTTHNNHFTLNRNSRPVGATIALRYH